MHIWSHSPSALFITMLLTAAAVVAGPPERAEAGTYTIHSCRTPDGAAADVSNWNVSEGRFQSALDSHNGCPRGPFELEMLSSKTHPSDHYIVARYFAPADTVINAYRLWRSVQLADYYGWRLRERTPAGLLDLDRCYAAFDCFSKGDPADPLGTGNLRAVTNRTDLTGLELVLTCAQDDATSNTCPAKAPGAKAQLHRADITLSDAYSPVVTSLTGPLVDPTRILTGTQPVTIAATDKGGGVYQALIEVDGRVVEAHTIDPNGGACAPPFRTSVPCRLSASGTATLNTAALPDGEHSLRILVSDVTGTNVAVWGPTTIRTANAFCNPDPHGSSLKLRARVGKKKRRVRAITVRYGRTLRVTGRLTGPGRAPIPGASVCVVARDDFAGASLRAYRTITTNAKGRFSYKLHPGASRRVFFVHRTSDGAIVGSVKVRVRARISLRGSRRSLRNGQTLRLRGRLGARPFPRRGVIVELQARRATGWQTFGTTRTNRRGRYSFPYTFTRTQGVQRFDLRARVPKQAVYPFANGASRPLRVFVFG